MNSLYQELNQQTQPQNNNFNMLSDLAEFAKNFRGDAKGQVQQLIVANGISQDAYNNAVQQANMIYGMLTGRR